MEKVGRTCNSIDNVGNGLILAKLYFLKTRSLFAPEDALMVGKVVLKGSYAKEVVQNFRN
jgi:hypothetical protein